MRVNKNSQDTAKPEIVSTARFAANRKDIDESMVSCQKYTRIETRECDRVGGEAGSFGSLPETLMNRP